MAESYRGLTIRIGGDTTKLSQALRSANGPIRETESALRTLSQALRMDPGNTEAVSLQVGYMGQRAEDTAYKLSILREALRQTQETKLDGQSKSVGELADETANASLRAQAARESYNKVTTELAKLDKQASDLSKQMAKAISPEFAEQLRRSLTFDAGSIDLASVEHAFDSLPEHLRPGQEAIEEFARKVEAFKKSYAEAADNRTKDRIVRQFEELRDKMAELSGTTFNFENANNDVEEFRELFKSLPPDIKLSDDEVERFISSMDKLKSEFKEAFSELRVSNQISQLGQLRAETEKYESTLRSVAKQAVEVGKLDFMNASIGNTEDLDRINAALERAKERFVALDKAMKLNPDNVRLAQERAVALKDATELANQKTVLLNRYVSAIDGSKVDELRAKYGSLQAAVEETTKAAEEAGVAYNKAVGELANTTAADDGAKKILNDLLNLSVPVDELARKLASLGVGPELSSSILKARSAVEETKSAFESAKDAANTAYACEQQENLRGEVRSTGAELDSVFGTKREVQLDEAAFQMAVSRMAQLARQAGQQIVESANTIDAAYRDMRKTVNGTEEDFEALRREAIEFSQTHVTSADTLLEMESLGGQLGVAVGKLREFGEVASNLDIATDIDAETIALQLGQITNVMSDLDGDTVDNFADALVRLGNNMPATESSIMAVAQRMSSVADTAKMSTPDVLALSAAIASTGQRSESAATAFNNTITGIESAVSAGGEDLEGFASIANMTASEFAAAWRGNPTEALKAFIQGLASMSDSNESAIAALENMGISSVRQEQALLGLTSTVENLDDALTMSNDAFNGVEDQWGAAGDAAREAQQKSEGFSGSLGILQNNADNLAASLGDAMVVPMQALSLALKTITDLLNALPAPIKTVVVGLGGMAAVLGTTYPLVEKLTDKYGPLASAVKVAGSEFADAVSEGKSFSDALGSVTGGSTEAAAGLANLGTALKVGLFAVGITAAIAAIGLLVSALADVIEQARRVEEAKDSLAESTQRLAEAADGAVPSEDSLAESIKNVSMTASDAADAIEEIARRQNDLAESFEDKNASYEVDVSMIEEAQAVIEKYANSVGQLTYGEQADLINAVETLNGKMGKSYEVIDAANGIIREQGNEANLTADELDKLVQEHEAMLRSSMLMKEIEDATKNLWDAEKDLAESEQTLADMRDKGADKVSNIVMSSREAVDANLGLISSNSELMNSYKQAQSVNDANKTAVESYKSVLADLKQQLHDLGTEQAKTADESAAAFEEMLGSLDAFTEGLSDTNMIPRFAEQIRSLGATTESFGALTAYQMTTIARAYDGTVESISNALRNLGVAFENSMRTVEIDQYTKEQIEAEKELLDQLYKERKESYERDHRELKNALDAEYKARQKAYDAEYKAAQKAYDAEYKALQKALDSEYKARQKAYDAEYKELQSALDAEYKAAQKAYDAEYKALQKTLDAEYKARQKAYDAEYKALQKSLGERYDAQKKAYDKAYDAQKKELDRELKQAQKASKQYLKDYKKSLDEQTDAFKKATDSRIDDIKRELAAKKELIDADTQSKTDDIDERIAALKAETEAEDAENKARQRNEKIAELQSAVDRAKSRRTRQEAEKALSDYLREIQQEDAREQREALIKQLEQERSEIVKDGEERKELLDTQYQTQIDQYKEMRSQMLEALQESLDLEYEMAQEHEDQRLESLKESQTAQLEAIKERQSIELESLKENQSEQLEAVKERQSLELEALKESQTAQLEAVKENQSLELEALKESHTAQLEAMKENQSLELDALKESQSERLESLKESQSLELESLKEYQSEQLEQLKQAQSEQLENDKAYHDSELESLKKANEDRIEEMRNAKVSVVEESNQTAEGMSKAAETAKGNVKRTMGELIANAQKEMQVASEKAVQETKEAGGSVAEQVKAGAEAAQKAASTGEAGILTDMRSAAKEAIEESRKGGGSVAEQVKAGAEAARKEAQKNGIDIVADSKSAKDEVIANAKDATDGVASTISGASGEVESAAGSYADGASSGVSSVRTTFGDYAREAVGAFKSFIETASAFQESQGLALTGESGLASVDASNAGYEFTSGFVGGANAYDVYTAAWNIGISALDAIKAALGIASPSKEAMKVGQFFGVGLVQGIDSGETDVERQSRLLAEALGKGFENEFASGLDDARSSVYESAMELMDVTRSALESVLEWSKESGFEAGMGFAEGLASSIPRVDGIAQRIAEAAAAYLRHSTPKKGPMSNDDEWGVHLVENLVDGMGSMESRLVEQARRMASIVEEGFDPTLSIDAAYDAMSRFESGRSARQEQAVAASLSREQPVTTINVNLNLSDVTIRSDDDLDELARRLAKRFDQMARAKIGR